MEALSEYSYDVMPTYEEGGINDCCDTSSVKPYDTSPARSSLEARFDECISVFQDIQNSVNGQLEQLADDWGTKFISIDGKALGIVNAAKFTEYYDKIIKGINDIKNECLNYCNGIEITTSNVNNYLNRLQEMYDSYLSLIEEKKTVEAQNPVDEDRLNSLNYLISYYNVIDAESIIGSWVKNC